ncbi:MAG: hypothetical protein LBJ43_01730 [Propionibacteriaceae bacterium]|jgi:hypothetical protein|nr:hypothetical protein [Propionibacteriaceae bacterium]
MGRQGKWLSMLLACLLLPACSPTGDKEEESAVFNFDTKIYIEDQADGWIEYFTFDYSKNGQSKTYDYGGYNLKYKSLDGYKVPIITEDGDIVGYAEPPLPAIVYDQSRVNDVITVDEFLPKNNSRMRCPSNS